MTCLSRASAFLVVRPSRTRAAAIAVLTSADRYVGVQGSAGVGKTTMFKVLKVAAKNDEFIGLAAQHDAAQVLFNRRQRWRA